MARGVPRSGGIFEIRHFSALLEECVRWHCRLFLLPFFTVLLLLDFSVILDCPSHYLLPSAPLLSGSGASFVGGSWALWGKFTSLGDANEESHYWSW